MSSLIVMLVCLANDPSVCKSVGLPLFDAMPTSTHSCFYMAQIKMAEWISEHEGWVIKRFDCDTNKTFGERI